MTCSKTIRAAAITLTLLTAACQGAPPQDLSDAEKRAKIEAMFQEYQQSFPEVPALTVPELVKQRGEIVLVDTRTPEEQSVSMIPGAITQEEFESEQDSYADKRIVTYCTIGYRSGIYAAKLRDAGIDAANLKGSVLAWAHAGKPFGRNGQKTKRAHVYGPKWNLLPDGYEPVW